MLKNRFELETFGGSECLTERHQIDQAALPVLEPMRGPGPREAVVRKVILERLEAGAAFDDHNRVCILRHARGLGIEQELGHEGADDAKGYSQLSQAAHEVGKNQGKPRLNAGHGRESWARGAPPPRVLVRCPDNAAPRR